MPLFRRRSNPELAEAFRASAEHLDRAQRALLAAIPTSRDPGVPLQRALEQFEERLTSLERTIDRWRVGPIEDHWQACRHAIAQAREHARQLEAAGPLGFEALNARAGDVLAPLEAFTDAARAIRAL